jgi:hypothetical protein
MTTRPSPSGGSLLWCKRQCAIKDEPTFNQQQPTPGPPMIPIKWGGTTQGAFPYPERMMKGWLGHWHLKQWKNSYIQIFCMRWWAIKNCERKQWTEPACYSGHFVTRDNVAQRLAHLNMTWDRKWNKSHLTTRSRGNVKNIKDNQPGHMQSLLGVRAGAAQQRTRQPAKQIKCKSKYQTKVRAWQKYSRSLLRWIKWHCSAMDYWIGSETSKHTRIFN